MSDQHRACLRCWTWAMQHAPVLQTADVLVFAGASSPLPRPEAEEHERQWNATIRALPNPNITYIRSSYNPGHQSGAKWAMYAGVKQGWFSDQYDWIVRLNPDVMVLDERPLVGLLQSSRSQAVFLAMKNVTCSTSYGHGVETDIYAFRPGAISPDVVDRLRCWGPEASDTSNCSNLLNKTAENFMAGAFRSLMKRGQVAWLTSSRAPSDVGAKASRVTTAGLWHMGTNSELRESCGPNCAKAWASPAQLWHKLLERQQTKGHRRTNSTYRTPSYESPALHHEGPNGERHGQLVDYSGYAGPPHDPLPRPSLVPSPLRSQLLRLRSA